MTGMGRVRLVLVLTFAAACLLPTSAAARTEGPFTAQIVDAETGAPLAGVVVVAMYRKNTPGGIHPETTFYDLDETLTDEEGRFFLPAKSLPISTPRSHVVGPEFIIFKAGYKGWRFRGVEHGRHADPRVRDDQNEEGWRKFRSAGVVIEIDRARTRDDRSEALSHTGIFPWIPEGRAPRLRKARDDELSAIQMLR